MKKKILPHQEKFITFSSKSLSYSFSLTPSSTVTIYSTLGVYFTTTNLYDSFSFPFKINYVLVFLGFGKMFIILRVVLIRQSYMSPRSNRLCRMYGCESNYLYAVKCLFKDSPMSLIGIVFVCSILFFALGLRIA